MPPHRRRRLEPPSAENAAANKMRRQRDHLHGHVGNRDSVRGAQLARRLFLPKH